MHTPETLAYSYSISHPDERVRNRTIGYFESAFEDAIALGTSRVVINLGCGLRDIDRMLKQVGYENLKVCLDVVAMEVSGDTVDDFFRVLGNQIVHIHLLDSNPESLGEAVYPVKIYLKELKKPALRGMYLWKLMMQFIGEILTIQLRNPWSS